jgi:hypothetical protein
MSKRHRSNLIRLAVLAAFTFTALAWAPTVAQANDEQGHPEGYSDFKKLEKLPLEPTEAEIDSKAVAGESWGQYEMESEQLPGGFIECAVVAFGDGWNAPVSPVFGLRGRGQVLGFSALGHLPVRASSEELSSHCRGIGGKAWVVTETPLERIGKKTICKTEGKKLSECPGVEEREVVYKEFKRENTQTVPWNVEAICRDTEIEEGVFEYEGLVKVGIPDKNSKHPNFGGENTTGCKTPAELKSEEGTLRTETEAEQTTQEGEGKHGSSLELKSCYAKRGVPGDTPAGCLRVDVISPAEGFEDPFGGTFKSTFKSATGVSIPATWFQSKGEGGELQCENEGCTAFGTAGGKVTVTGNELQQLQMR